MAKEQMHLGGDIEEEVDFEHSVHIPVNLFLDQEINGEAIAVYAVMRSFGKRSQASLDSYGKRLGWTSDRVRKFQGFLVRAGWMILVKEGTMGQARRWWMASQKDARPPLNIFSDGYEKPLAFGKSIASNNTPPKQGLSSNYKLSSKNTPAKAGAFTATDGSTWADLVEDYDKAFKLAKADPRAKIELTPTECSKLKKLAKHTLFTRTLFQARLSNMNHHSFHKQKEFSLGWFCDNFKEFDDKAEAIVKGKRGGRAGSYLAVKSVEDFKG